MKKTDLEKNKGLKLMNDMRQSGASRRFAAAAATDTGRKEQRKLDQAKGLIAVAVKLDGELVAQLRARAQADKVGLDAAVEALLRKGLANSA